MNRAALGVSALNTKQQQQQQQQQQIKSGQSSSSLVPVRGQQNRPNLPKTNAKVVAKSSHNNNSSNSSSSNNNSRINNTKNGKSTMDDPAQMLNAWLGELDSLQKVR